MRRARWSRLAVLGLVGPTIAAAQVATPVVPILSMRVRAEAWDWFDVGSAGQYTFVAAHLRAGVMQQQRLLQWRVELAAPILIGLPTDAMLAAPAGALGLGANYALANAGRRNVAGLFVKQAVVRFGGPTTRVRSAIGRFEFADGGEYTPPDTVLAAIRQQRLDQRLIGTFGFTHGQRSFDGASVAVRVGPGAVSATAVRPTTGVFDVDGAGSLPVDVIYAAWSTPVTVASAPHDARLFALHVEDRRGTIPVDARPSSARSAAPRHVGVTTIGGHWLGRRPLGPFAMDIFGWTAQQFGRWGGQTHRAGAFAIEAGAQLPSPWAAPGVRLGFTHGSGDARPSDEVHGTFYQALPTPRPFAPFPFYDLQNVRETFVQLHATPRRGMRLAASARTLRVDEAADLWYVGGGAYDRRTFGFTGRPTGDNTGLGSTIDVAVDWRVSRHVSVSGYLAMATGGPAIAASYGRQAHGRFAFVETTVRY